MALIVLGTVTLYEGMTLTDAKNNDERIKEANHGQTPVDKDGKELQTNVALFQKYDANNDLVIDQKEYAKYREDVVEHFKKQMESAEKQTKDLYDALKTGNHEQNKQKLNFAL